MRTAALAQQLFPALALRAWAAFLEDMTAYDLFVEIDSIPQLAFVEPNGEKTYVCSIESAGYVPAFTNNSLDPVIVEWAIDSKGSYSWTSRETGKLETCVRTGNDTVTYVSPRFAGLALAVPNANEALVPIPVEELEKLGRIDAWIYPAKPSDGSHVVIHQTIDDVQPTLNVPHAKRKVGGCSSQIEQSGNSKVARLSGLISSFRRDSSATPVQITLYYRPSRIMRFYGLVGMQAFDMPWAVWLSGNQFTRIPGFRAPDLPVQPPNAATPPSFQSPVPESQARINTDLCCARPALQQYAAANGLLLIHESEDLYGLLAVFLWGGVQRRDLVVSLVQFQRHANYRHYTALKNVAGWSEEAVILKAFSDFLQIPVALHTPLSAPEVQVLISPLMLVTHVCFAIGMLSKSWVALRGTVPVAKPSVVINVDD